MKKIFTTLFATLFMFGNLVAEDKIVINEIMYNNPGADVEFIELYNVSNADVNLAGWYILDDNDDHAKCFLAGTLSPGQYLVVVGNKTDFGALYPNVTNINTNAFDVGDTGWGLGNGSDVVRLFDNSNNLHDIVAYQDGGDWPGSPDGNGPSLELLYPALDNSLPTSWDPSKADGGTPGQQNSVFTQNSTPFCKDGQRYTDLPTSSDNVVVSVIAFDNEGLAKVELFVNTGGSYVAQSMYDDGTHGDVAANDSVYATTISAKSSGTLVKYYAMATDDIGQVDYWPNNAPAEYHAYTADYKPPKLMISEALAVNTSIIKDEYGEYDDWFEIYNADDHAVNLNGMFVGNTLGDSRAFELPNVTIEAGKYLLIWADSDQEQGTLHTNFKLSSEGESVAIFETIDHGNVLIHGWKFGRMSSDVSVGFLPLDGTAPEYLATPTPGASNSSSKLFSPVCINEFQSTSDFGGTDDWIEIYNRGDEPFDLTGCYLADSRSNNTKWTFPAKILQPGEFLVVYEDVLEFGLSSGGDDVIMLSSSDSTIGLDFYDMKEQQPDKSEGRYPDGINYWTFFNTPTKEGPNSGPMEVHENTINQVTGFKLENNYPNPFNPSTFIQYQLPKQSNTVLTIFDINGREVKKYTQNNQAPGTYSVLWNAVDNWGNSVSSGVYFYKLQVGDDFSQTHKMLLIK